MTVLSKAAGGLGLRVLPHNCHELAHTWRPSCVGATLDVTRAAAAFSLKAYASLYALSLLARRPRSLRDVQWRRLLRDVLTSTAFLTSNAFWYIGLLCLSRRALGFFVWPLIGGVNGFGACALSILIERKSRRPALALYFTNLATEVAFNLGREAGWWPAIPNGQVLIFAAAMAGYQWLLHRDELGPETARLLRLVYGPEEEAALDGAFVPAALAGVLQRLRSLGRPSPLCRHPHSCASAAAERFLRNFALAGAASLGLRLLGSLPSLLREPRRLAGLLLDGRNLRLPLMLGSLAGLRSGAECGLCQLGVRNERSAAAAGFVSGLSLLFYPNITLAMYAASKLAEAGFWRGVEAGRWRAVAHGDALLYCLSTGFVLSAAAIAPHSIRRGYWGFIDQLTGGHFSHVNRPFLDSFGFDSGRLFRRRDFPALHPLHTTTNPAFVGLRSIWDPPSLASLAPGPAA